jgi:hypothetical protein
LRRRTPVFLTRFAGANGEAVFPWAKPDDLVLQLDRRNVPMIPSAPTDLRGERRRHRRHGPLTPNGPRDPNLGKGAIRAFGEHKGSGLALICELLGGSLTGTGATKPGRRFANGVFSLYVDPARMDPFRPFDGDAARYLDWFRQAKTMPGRTMLRPGEAERASRANRLAKGVPLPRKPGTRSPPRRSPSAWRTPA